MLRLIRNYVKKSLETVAPKLISKFFSYFAQLKVIICHTDELIPPATYKSAVLFPFECYSFPIPNLLNISATAQ